LVWHIWWLAIAGLLATIVTLVVRSLDEDTDYFIPAAEVARLERIHMKEASEA
jgi:cytochrome o ubiquinol oxidase subunit 1